MDLDGYLSLYIGWIIFCCNVVTDLMLTLTWLALAISGAVHQWRQQRGRPPFPPASARAQPPDERTPLLMPTSTLDPSDQIILIHSVPYDG